MSPDHSRRYFTSQNVRAEIRHGFRVITGAERRERERQKDFKTIYEKLVMSLSTASRQPTFLSSKEQYIKAHPNVGKEKFSITISTDVEIDAALPPQPDTISLDIENETSRGLFNVTRNHDDTYNVQSIRGGVAPYRGYKHYPLSKQARRWLRELIQEIPTP